MAINEHVLDRIATGLIRAGYPGVTPIMVKDQLSMPRNQRNIIGMWAASALVDYGVWKSVDQVLEKQ